MRSLVWSRRMLCGIFAVLVMFSLLLTGAFEGFAADRVKYCYDGDTFVLESGKKVRLAGIDTPEMGHNGERNQFYAVKSRQLLIDLVQGKNVRLASVGGGESYGRAVVEVFLQDGRSVNEILVREGAAYFYFHKDTSQALIKKLMRAQSLAIKEKKGMWAGLLKSPAANKKYTGNRNSNRLFSQGCDGVEKIAKKNRMYFDSLADAFEAGFSPVRACNIWPLE